MDEQIYDWVVVSFFHRTAAKPTASVTACRSRGKPVHSGTSMHRLRVYDERRRREEVRRERRRRGREGEREREKEGERKERGRGKVR